MHPPGKGDYNPFDFPRFRTLLNRMREHPTIRILAQCGKDDHYVIPALAFMMMCRWSMAEEQFDVIYCTKTHNTIKQPFLVNHMSRLQVLVYGVEEALKEEGYQYKTETPPDWYYQKVKKRNSDYRAQFDHVEEE